MTSADVVAAEETTRRIIMKRTRTIPNNIKKRMKYKGGGGGGEEISRGKNKKGTIRPKKSNHYHENWRKVEILIERKYILICLTIYIM